MLTATTDSNHTYLLAIMGHIHFWAIPYSSFSLVQTSMNQPLKRWKKLQLITTHKLQTITPLDSWRSQVHTNNNQTWISEYRLCTVVTNNNILWFVRTSWPSHVWPHHYTHGGIPIHKANQWFEVVWPLHISPCIPQQLTRFYVQSFYAQCSLPERSKNIGL